METVDQTEPKKKPDITRILLIVAVILLAGILCSQIYSIIDSTSQRNFELQEKQLALDNAKAKTELLKVTVDGYVSQQKKLNDLFQAQVYDNPKVDSAAKQTVIASELIFTQLALLSDQLNTIMVVLSEP